MTFVETLARQQCKGHVDRPCQPCQAREVLGYDPRERNDLGTASMKDWTCPECEIGHHEHCDNDRCTCPCL